jgi:hypothetical protein
VCDDGWMNWPWLKSRQSIEYRSVDCNDERVWQRIVWWLFAVAAASDRKMSKLGVKSERTQNSSHQR